MRPRSAALWSACLSGDEALVDMDRLKPGDDWCVVLYQWLAMCDAAVVLFGRKALASPWVRREVDILLWRHALSPSFRVVPALLGGVDRNDLKANGFDDVTRLHLARIPPQTETKADAGQLAAVIANSLPPRVPEARDPMARWVLDVAECLQLTDARLRRHLILAAKDLGIADDDMPGRLGVR